MNPSEKKHYKAKANLQRYGWNPVTKKHELMPWLKKGDDFSIHPAYIDETMQRLLDESFELIE